MRTWRLLTAAVVIAAVAWSAATTCVPVNIAEMQMACCHSGPSDATVVKTTVIARPAPVATSALTVPQFSLAVVDCRGLCREIPDVIPLSPPPCIEFSALLI